ncbi:MAG: hypothetical protein PUC65_13625 [Clostridiales bacterium]|nr:hypothetical protein [Clostridiales bacterium]
MKAEEIIRLGGLVFDRIEEGFDHYESEVITKSSPELYQILMEMIQKNGWENSFVDFYFGRLLKEEQERILQVVPVYWHDILKQYEENQEIYYPLTENLLKLTWFLTDHEYLFSTYYFCKEPCTIWGNYNNTLVKFYKKKEVT